MTWPGGPIIEVKNRRAYAIGEWLDETEVERKNAGRNSGLLVVKPRGVGLGRVGDWWAIQRVDDWMDLFDAWDQR